MKQKDIMGKFSINDQEKHGKLIKAALVPFLLARRAMAMRREGGM
jgi:hypothetical protein